MPETLTESFCERCGTRYTFEAAAPKGKRLGKLKVFSKGFVNFVSNDDRSLDEALAEARSDEQRELTGQQLDAFHQTFQFCMSCRQYTCANCWNEVESRCLSCAPQFGGETLGGSQAGYDPLARIGFGQPTPELHLGNGHLNGGAELAPAASAAPTDSTPVLDAAWPTADQVNGDGPAPALPWPELAALPETVGQPADGAPDGDSSSIGAAAGGPACEPEAVPSIRPARRPRPPRCPGWPPGKPLEPRSPTSPTRPRPTTRSARARTSSTRTWRLPSRRPSSRGTARPRSTRNACVRQMRRPPPSSSACARRPRPRASASSRPKPRPSDSARLPRPRPRASASSRPKPRPSDSARRTRRPSASVSPPRQNARWPPRLRPSACARKPRPSGSGSPPRRRPPRRSRRARLPEIAAANDEAQRERQAALEAEALRQRLAVEAELQREREAADAERLRQAAEETERQRQAEIAAAAALQPTTAAPILDDRVETPTWQIVAPETTPTPEPSPLDVPPAVLAPQPPHPEPAERDERGSRSDERCRTRQRRAAAASDRDGRLADSGDDATAPVADAAGRRSAVAGRSGNRPWRQRRPVGGIEPGRPQQGRRRRPVVLQLRAAAVGERSLLSSLRDPAALIARRAPVPGHVQAREAIGLPIRRPSPADAPRPRRPGSPGPRTTARSSPRTRPRTLRRPGASRRAAA